jgi:hypothetical protein
MADPDWAWFAHTTSLTLAVGSDAWDSRGAAAARAYKLSLIPHADVGAAGVDLVLEDGALSLFRIRVDTYPVSGPALKAEVARRIEAWCAAHGVSRAPKSVRADTKDAVTDALRPKLPTPKYQEIAVLRRPGKRPLVAYTGIAGKAVTRATNIRRALLGNVDREPAPPPVFSEEALARALRALAPGSGVDAAALLELAPLPPAEANLGYVASYAQLTSIRLSYDTAQEGITKLAVSQDVARALAAVGDRPVLSAAGKVALLDDGGEPITTFVYDFGARTIGAVTWHVSAWPPQAAEFQATQLESQLESLHRDFSRFLTAIEQIAKECP